MKKKRVFFSLFFIFLSIYLNSENLVLFSPKENISNKLIEHINNSKKRIYVAIYMLTDKKISQALCDAKNLRGVDVQVVTDQSCLESEYGKIDLLKENGVEVFVFKPNLKGKKIHNPIMHNKFALFDNKTWTGSFNWTVSANTRNFENIVCLDDSEVCSKYEKQFEKLKRKCMKNNSGKKNVKTKRNDNNKVDHHSSYQSLKDKTVNLLKTIRNRFISN